MIAAHASFAGHERQSCRGGPHDATTDLQHLDVPAGRAAVLPHWLLLALVLPHAAAVAGEGLMRSGTQPTSYRIEMIIQGAWRPTIHTFSQRKAAQAAFKTMLAEHPTWWLRLVSVTVLETVTP